MPYITTWEPTGIKWEFYGAVTSEEVDEANREMYEDSRFESINYFIWDMSNVEKLIKDKFDNDMPVATDFGASHTNANISGALVAKKGHVYDSCNRYIKLSKELNTTWKLKLFTDNVSALNWLTS